MHKRNNARRLLTTACAANRRVGGILVTLLVIGASAESLPAAEPPSAIGALLSAADPSTPPSPEATMRAFKAIDGWVRVWEVPDDDLAAIVVGADGKPLPAVYGVCVNLRLHGRLIGRGVTMVPAASADPDAKLLVLAVAKAIAEADPRMPVPNDLNRAEAIKLLAADIQISLELAGQPTPLSEETWAGVDAILSPGLDGLMSRVEQAEPEVAFPSAMMMAGLTPQKTMRGIVSNAIGEDGATEVLRPLKELREKYECGLWRFRVSHAAQAKPGAEPVFLYRGARLIGQSQLGSAGLRDLAAAAAARVAIQLESAANRAESKPNDTLTDAIATYSLARYSDYARDPSLARIVEESLARLALVVSADEKNAGPQPTLCAAVLLASTAACAADFRRHPSRDLPGPDNSGLPDSCRLSQSTVIPALQCFLPGVGFESTVPPAARPLVALSFVEASLLNAARPVAALPFDPGQLTKTARSALAGEMLVVKPGELVSRMPWLGWAAVGAAESGTDVNAAVALREMRSEIWKHQLPALAAGDDGADMVGGIVFTSGTTSPLPTWQCVRPLAFLATMLGDTRLTEPGERDFELARLLQAFRFLRQLQVDESCGWMYADPEPVIGAIRAATWEQTLPPDATSLTLLATCELLRSMDKLAAAEAARQRPVLPAE